jgi:hypothetical protein
VAVRACNGGGMGVAEGVYRATTRCAFVDMHHRLSHFLPHLPAVRHHAPLEFLQVFRNRGRACLWAALLPCVDLCEVSLHGVMRGVAGLLEALLKALL